MIFNSLTDIAHAFEICDRLNHYKTLSVVLNTEKEKKQWIHQIKMVLKEVQIRELRHTINLSIEQKRTPSTPLITQHTGATATTTTIVVTEAATAAATASVPVLLLSQQ